MYKFLSRHISKSHSATSNFTTIYRKVSKTQKKSYIVRKRSMSETSIKSEVEADLNVEEKLNEFASEVKSERNFPAVWTRNYNYHPIQRSIFFEKPKTAPQLRLHDTPSKDVFTSGFYQINKKPTKQISPYVRDTDMYREAMECTNQCSNTKRQKKPVTSNYSCINLQLSPIKVEEYLHETKINRYRTGPQKQRPRKKQIIQPKQLPQVQQKSKKVKKCVRRNLKKPFEIKYPITNVKQKTTFGGIRVSCRTDKLDKKKKKGTVHLSKRNGKNHKQITQERKMSYNKAPTESSKSIIDKKNELKMGSLTSRSDKEYETTYQSLKKLNSNSENYNIASKILLKNDSEAIQAVPKSKNNKFKVPNVNLDAWVCTLQPMTSFRSMEKTKNKNTIKLVTENAGQQNIESSTKHLDFKDQGKFTNKEKHKLAQVKLLLTNIASNSLEKSINTKNAYGRRSHKPIEINSKNSSDIKANQIFKGNKVPPNIDNTQKTKENDFKPLKEYIDVNKVTSYHLEDDNEVRFLTNLQREKTCIQEIEFLKDTSYGNTTSKDDIETNQIFYKNFDKTKVIYDVLKENAKVDYFKQHRNTAGNSEKKSFHTVKKVGKETVIIPMKDKTIQKPIYARKLNFHERSFSSSKLRGKDFSKDDKQTRTKYKQKPSSYMELALLKDSSNREKHVYNDTNTILHPKVNVKQDENILNTDNEINKILASKDFVLENGKMIFKIPKVRPKLSTPEIGELYTETLDNSENASNMVNSAERSSMEKEPRPKSIVQEDISTKVLKISKPVIKISLPDLIPRNHWSLLNKQKKHKLYNPIKIKELEAKKISARDVCQIDAVNKNTAKKPSIKVEPQSRSSNKDYTIEHILRKPKIIIKVSHLGEKRKLGERPIMIKKLDPQKELKSETDICNSLTSNNKISKIPLMEKAINHIKQYDDTKVSGKSSPLPKTQLPNLCKKDKLHPDLINQKMMDPKNRLKSYIDTCQSINLDGNKVERPSIRKEPPPSNKKEDKDKKNPRKPKPAIRFPPSSNQEKPKLYDDSIKSKELSTEKGLKFDTDIGQSDTDKENKTDKKVTNNDNILRGRLKYLIAYVKELQNKNDNSNLIKQAGETDKISTRPKKCQQLPHQVFGSNKNKDHENDIKENDGSKTISEQLKKVLKLNSDELSVENIKVLSSLSPDHVTELNNTSTSKNQPLPPHIIRKIMKLKLQLDKGTNHKQGNENDNVISVVTKSQETSIQKPVLKQNHSDSSLMTVFLLDENEEINTVSLDKTRPSTAPNNIKKSKSVNVKNVPLKRMPQSARSSQNIKKAKVLIPELSRGKDSVIKSKPENIKTLDTGVNMKPIQFKQKLCDKTNMDKMREITLNPIDKIGSSKTLAETSYDKNQLNKENARDTNKKRKSENVRSDIAINIKRIHREKNYSAEKYKENVENIIKDSLKKQKFSKTLTEKTFSSDGTDHSKKENINYATKRKNNTIGKSKNKKTLNITTSHTRVHCQENLNDKMKEDKVLEIVRDPVNSNKLFKRRTEKAPTNDIKDQSKAEIIRNINKKSINTKDHVAKNKPALKRSNVFLKIKNSELNKIRLRVELQNNKVQNKLIECNSKNLAAVGKENTISKTKFVSKEPYQKSKNERNNSEAYNINKTNKLQVTQNSTFNNFNVAEKNVKDITEIKKTDPLVENIRPGEHFNEEIKIDKKANNEKTNKKDEILLSADNIVRIVVDIAKEQKSTSVEPTAKASYENKLEKDTNKSNNTFQSDLHLNAASKNYFNHNLKTSFDESIADVEKDTIIEETKHPETLVMIDLRNDTSEVKFLDMSTKHDLRKSSSHTIISKTISKSLEKLNKVQRSKNYFRDNDYSYINRRAKRMKEARKFDKNKEGKYYFNSHLSNVEKKVKNKSEQESKNVSEIKNAPSAVSMNEYSNKKSTRNFSALSTELTENISNTDLNTFTKKVIDKSKHNDANKNSIKMYSKDPDKPIDEKHKEKVDKKANKSEKQKKALDKKVNKTLNKSETKVVKAPSYFRGGRRYNKITKPPTVSAGRSKNIQKSKTEKNQTKRGIKNPKRRSGITFLLQNQLLSDLDRLKLLKLIGKEDLDKMVEKLKINPSQVNDSDFYSVSAVEKELHNRRKSRDKMYRDFRKKMSDLLEKAKTVKHTGKSGTKSVAPTVTSNPLKKRPVDVKRVSTAPKNNPDEITKNKDIQKNFLKSPGHLVDVDKQSKTSNETKTKNVEPTKASSSKTMLNKQTKHSTNQIVDVTSKENAVELSEKTKTGRDNNIKSDNNKRNAKGTENDKKSPKASLNDTAEISGKQSKSTEKSKEREFQEVVREELTNIFENGPPNVNQQTNLVAKVEEIMDTNKTLWKFNKNFNKKLYDHLTVSSKTSPYILRAPAKTPPYVIKAPAKTSPYVLKAPVTIEKELKTFSDIKQAPRLPEYQKKECVSILIPPRDLRRFLDSIKNNDATTLLNKLEEKPMFEQKTELPRYYGPKITYMAVNKSETERSCSEKGSNKSLKESKTLLEPNSKFNSKTHSENKNVKNEDDENDPKLK
ncbi:MATH and LRR domain-containing protein PFE0570w-like isoform X2 [Diabrotica virgifera virgifera]|uniref:MATH and LRR domain-containing protein PFE0570w-like n=1 Tax=Diabrotica virgifera virgifera TaxID=50390 RepID=A0ABM5JUI0_DIAVI|nr:MATH and LRR domain-containing protein PFE0570w-like isoform X2 [Diabrotica virgifera virgifera]